VGPLGRLVGVVAGDGWVVAAWTGYVDAVAPCVPGGSCRRQGSSVRLVCR
jgi:hypothetical protein